MVSALKNLILLTPLMLFPMLAYSVAGYAGPIETEAFRVTMMSGSEMIFVWGHFLTLIGAVCLAIEIIKALGYRARAKFEFFASLTLLIAGILAFVMVRGYGNPVFLILVVFQFIDVLAGSLIMTKTAERDISFGG